MHVDRTHNRPAKILLTKIGLDGHDRGSRLVASYLRDDGMDVTSTGPWQKIPDVVKLAAMGEVDVIGISSLAGDHVLVPKLMRALHDADLGQVAVVIGGIVPDCDLQMLSDAGVAHVFHPGSSRDEIIASIYDLAQQSRTVDMGDSAASDLGCVS